MIVCAAIAAALASASPGAIITATGTCDAPLVLRNRNYGGVVLDAAAARFPAGAVMNGIAGLSVRGGFWGRADIGITAWHTIRIDNAADFSLTGATVVGNGDAVGSGILVATSQRVTIRNNDFQGHATGIGVRASSDVLVALNRISGSTADGINITDVQRAIVSANECRDFVPAPGAHPDCIQLRSVSTSPKQADIWVVNNWARGRMQAFFGAEYRTYHYGNLAETDVYTHTVTANACRQCEAFDNVLANTPSSANGPGSLKGFTDPSNRTGRNLLWDARALGWAPRRWSFVVPPIWNQVGSRFEDRSFNPPSSEAKAP